MLEVRPAIVVDRDMYMQSCVCGVRVCICVSCHNSRLIWVIIIIMK